MRGTLLRMRVALQHHPCQTAEAESKSAGLTKGSLMSHGFDGALAKERRKNALHQAMRLLYDSGWSDGRIADVVRAAQTTVTRWRRSHERRFDGAVIKRADSTGKIAS